MIVELDEVDSTQDVAHEMAEQGAAAGTVVVARSQRKGRGRMGRDWVSGRDAGIWCTVLERPEDAAGIGPLSVRVGLHLAEALEPLTGERILVKWPNDLLVRDGKLAGILVEARWSGPVPAWVAIGVGVNVDQPAVAGAAGLRGEAQRRALLDAVIGAVRRAATQRGSLGADELQRLRTRDALAGCRIVSPGRGVVEGIDATGALLVREAHGVVAHGSGTVQLEEMA